MDHPTSRIVLITGAAGGLGRALTDAFLTAGWRVAAGQHHADVHQPTATLRPLKLDVTNAAQVKAAVAEVTAAWGRIDVLINNAGLTADGAIASLM